MDVSRAISLGRCLWRYGLLAFGWVSKQCQAAASSLRSLSVSLVDIVGGLRGLVRLGAVKMFGVSMLLRLGSWSGGGRVVANRFVCGGS